MEETVIVDGLRTAIGAFGGSLAGRRASDLGATLIRALLERSRLDPASVDDVLLGQVLTAGVGQNPARQAALAAGMPDTVPAMTINQVCGSGLRAVGLAHQAIRAGDHTIIFAGGQENMSRAPHAVAVRSAPKMGDLEMVDTMIRDGLWCAMNEYHMGNTAENIANQSGISRKDQDTFAAHSQQLTAAAMEAGHFVDEILPIRIKVKRETLSFDRDEFPRPQTTVESLGKLRPAFDKSGTVTAGNASGINDGAAVLLIMSAKEAEKRQLEPLAFVRGFASAGVEPALMGMGPVPAVKRVLKAVNWKVDSVDLIEANEAFAAQAIAVQQELGLDSDRLNVNGGAIALGHPIGASGSRILVTLLYEMSRRKAKRGLATLCIGGGMGVAIAVERP